MSSALWLPPVAAAQGRGEADDAEYRSAVEEALQEFNRGNWEEAAALFERAHRINPSARTLRGMGLTAYEARRYVDAIRHLTDALADTRRPLTQAQRDEVSATLDRARRFVAHLRLKISPPGAKVTINGRPAALDNRGDIQTDPGLLEVEISADGHESTLRRVRLTAGGQEELAIQLPRVRSELPSSLEGPPRPASVPASSQAAGVDKGSSTVGTLKWIVGGVALAGLITGTVLLVLQKSEADEFQRTCVTPADNLQQHCVDLHSNVSVGGPLWTGPIVAFSVGGGLAAIATVLFVVDATDDEQSARSGCGPGPGELGVQCRVRF